MKSLQLTALCAVSLAGCCNPTVVKEPVEVKVPVPTPCVVELPVKPVWQMDVVGVKGGGLFLKGNSALIEIEQRRQYERELEAVLKSCTNSN